MAKRAPKDDPFKHPCSACGASINKPCRTVGKDDRLISKAARLVHAARLEGVAST